MAPKKKTTTKKKSEVSVAEKLNTESPTKEEAEKGVTIEDKVNNDGGNGQIDVPNGRKHRDLTLG